MSTWAYWPGGGIIRDKLIRGGARVGPYLSVRPAELATLTDLTLSSLFDTAILLYSVSVQLTAGDDDDRNNL